MALPCLVMGHRRCRHPSPKGSGSHDQLLIASGSYPIKPGIPGLDLLEVQSCRSMDDARRIMPRGPDSRALQIGAGFVGASSCRRW